MHQVRQIHQPPTFSMTTFQGLTATQWRNRINDYNPGKYSPLGALLRQLYGLWWPVAYDAPGGGVGRYARPAVPLARDTCG